MSFEEFKRNAEIEQVKPKPLNKKAQAMLAAQHRATIPELYRELD